MSYKKLSLRVCLSLVVLMSLVVLYGWIQNITIFKTLLPGRPDMKANAALCFLMASTAIGILLTVKTKLRYATAGWLSILLFSYAVLVLLEYSFHFDFRIDELFFIDPNGMHGHSPPGRFSPVTAVNFLLLAAGILFEVVPSRAWCRASQSFLMLCFLNAFQSFVGGAFNISYIFGMDLFIPMAVHTAFSFTLLSGILLALRYDQGLMQRFTAPTASALMSRRMLVAGLLVSPCLKALSLYGVQSQGFGEGPSFFLQSMGNVVFIGLIVVVTAGALLRNEQEQILARKLIEESRLQLEGAKNEAEAASLAKSQFLANMSHEIRTPLGIILGFSELGLESHNEPEEAIPFLRSIHRNAHELSKLLGEILDLSKVEANKLEAEKISFDWIAVIEEVFQSLRIKAQEKGIEFKLQLATELPRIIESDPTRFRQILFNLIGNAIKFTNNGKVQIDISVSADKVAQKFLCSIQVKDSGIGIDTEQAKFLFKPFSQADNSTTRKFGGTGLGLALSKQLAGLLDGDIRLIQSEPGVGSTFEFTFHSKMGLDEPFNTHSPAALDELNSIDLSSLQILVAEDSIDNQVLIGLYLRSTGAQLQIANNGLEAVEISLKKRFDVVLMDIQMPVMDGFRALQELRAQGYRGPVIAVTAHAMKEEQERALQAGFDHYLTKPLDKKILFAVLKSIKSQKKLLLN